MEADYASLKRQLLKLMGFAVATDAWMVTPIEESTATLEPVPTEEILLKTAEESRLDLQAARWTLAAAEQRIELMRREGWPEVMVGLGFERAPSAGSQGPSAAGTAGNALATGLQGMSEPYVPFSPNERDVKWTVGPMIDIELPIFDQNQAGVARAVHEFRQRWAEYSELWQTVASEVRETKVMHDQAHRQVEFFRDSILPEVQRNLDVVRESYGAGREQLTIFLQVQEDQIMTRLTALAFVRDLSLNRTELERQVGGKLTPRSDDIQNVEPKEIAGTQPAGHD
jgi:outer membrane protein TolC